MKIWIIAITKVKNLKWNFIKQEKSNSFSNLTQKSYSNYDNSNDSKITSITVKINQYR